MRKYALVVAGLLAAAASTPAQAMDYVLALSWQPAFCDSRPQKTECANQTPERFDATNFILHGLWPQPQSNSYCHVPQRDISNDKNSNWDDLPPVRLSEAVAKELATYMPGVQSHLDRHEWTKHGTCARRAPDDYFTLGMSLVKTMDKGATAALVRANIGNTVERQALCDAMIQDFGPDVVNSAQFKIGTVGKKNNQRFMLNEIWIYLTDHNSDSLALDKGDLKSGYGRLSCSGGPIYIDKVGFRDFTR